MLAQSTDDWALGLHSCRDLSSQPQVHATQKTRFLATFSLTNHITCISWLLLNSYGLVSACVLSVPRLDLMLRRSLPFPAAASAAGYDLHDLQPVAGAERASRKLRGCHSLAVVLDDDAAGPLALGEEELLQRAGHVGGDRLSVRDNLSRACGHFRPRLRG